ncbi:hypothetical protein LOAG_04214 [Loa loa]|uniref:Uncharacterized protein n=1 Tax=Loa loa TaxID=7209 RepID=A0A1S0U2W6_LOALO|nr:hypothetical protein LOAG_04214 [Loa loa]EFO24272.1 hypothetical protein LOAG_04214 [Loa loa]
MQCGLCIYICIYIIMIVVGGANVRNCSADDYLPVWMMVYGCTEFPGATRLYPIFTKVQHTDNEGLFYCPQSVYLLSFMIATIDLLISITVLFCCAFCARSVASYLMKNKTSF